MTQKNFHEDYTPEDVPLPSEKSTGLVFAVVALIVAAFSYPNLTVITICVIISALFAGLSFLAPHLLRPLNILWFKFSMLLYKVVNPIIMALMFLVAIVPLGLLMKIWRDPLRKKKQSDGESYWIERKNESSPPQSMHNQF